MAMTQEGMTDPGDGNGEGGGEISTLSNSDLQELEEKEMGEKEKENDMRAMKWEKWEKWEKEEKEKWEKEKEKWEKEKEKLWQLIIKMKMSGKEKGTWKVWKNKKGTWKEIEMVKEVWEEDKEMWEWDKEKWEMDKEIWEKDKKDKEKWEKDKEIWEKDKEIWEKDKKDKEMWEEDKEKWEKDKEKWEKDKEIWEKDKKDKEMWEKDKEKWKEDKEMWKEDKEMWEKDKEMWKEDKEMWEQDKEMWKEDKEMWKEDKEMWKKDKEKWEKDKEMWKEDKEKWEKDKEKWEKDKEIWEKDKEMWEKDEEIREIWGTKMKEKEPEPLLEWEMGMEKCPCLLGCGPEGKEPVLYLYNLLDERKSKIVEDKEYEDGKWRPGMQVITPVESIRPPVYYNMSVIVGSLLYVLGGVLEAPENEQEDPENEQEWSFHNEVFLFDTNHPQKGWIKGPNMINERCNGKAVAVESKIYVFGGNNKTVEDNSSTSRPWAEFLDPDKNKWEPLPAPPDIHTRDLLYNPVVYGLPGEGKKIFLSCCYYIYDVNVQTWEEFRPPESLRPFSHNLTNDGNILYWTTFGHLYSFDMKTQDIDCGLVEGYRLSKYREELLIPEPTLLHLDGDYFCFITLKDLPEEDRTKVRCTKFQVSHQGGLKASVVCRETYIIGHPLGIDNTYAFVLNGKLGAEKSEGSSSFSKLNGVNMQ